MEVIRRPANPDEGTAAEPTTYWLTRVLPQGIERSVVVAALLAGGLYVGGLLAARYAGETGYQGEPDFYLFAFGLFFEVLLLSNWSGRYPKLWASLNTPPTGSETPTFAVSGETYDSVVSRGLSRLYRLDVPLALFVIYHLFVIQFVFGDKTGVLNLLRLVNLTVVDLFGVFIVYLAVCHLLLLRDVFALPVADVDVALERVETVVDLSVVVAVQWFLALTVQSVYVFDLVGVVTQGFTSLIRVLATGTDADTVFPITLLEVMWQVDVAELLLLVGLLGVGVFVFVSTLFLVHTALAATKRREIRAISREYDRFYDLWEAEAESEDRLSVGLDILERRRESTSATRTWPYNASMLLRLGVSAQLPVISFVANVLLGG